MNLVSAIVFYVPVLLASIAFLVAAGLKRGEERGGTVFFLGALLLLLVNLAGPLIYAVIVPSMVESGNTDSLEAVLLALQLALGFATALAIVLLSVGTFLRPAPRQ